MRGPKPKPTERKKLEGNPGKRPLNFREPAMPSAGEAFDEPPAELGTDIVAVAEWQRLAPVLRRSRTVTEADRGALVALCQQWSRYLEANRSVSSAGMVVRSPSGYPMPNPYIAIANRALASCVKLWAEMGLTPSSRSRVTTVGDDAISDAFAEFDAKPSHVN
jgi:P27 family predicted phage terminase small subunit